nr:peptidylprolyl isomerase [Vandammella animalimorsus]
MLLTSPAAAQGKDKQPAASQPRVKLSTSMGDIVVALEPQKAPKTVENFLQYVQDKHYDGTIFHRVIDGFMIQGGGFSADMVQKPTRAPIVLEADNGLKNEHGTIAMARTMVPNSATSQFFINVNNNVPLNATPGNPGYAVFGKVVEGMDVVDKIKAVSTTSKGPHQNVPAETITILSATKVD